jgi:hypothetical protein
VPKIEILSLPCLPKISPRKLFIKCAAGCAAPRIRGAEAASVLDFALSRQQNSSHNYLVETSGQKMRHLSPCPGFDLSDPFFCRSILSSVERWAYRCTPILRERRGSVSGLLTLFLTVTAGGARALHWHVFPPGRPRWPSAPGRNPF